MVSRPFFMDKVTDHLLVFHGDARIQDFPESHSTATGNNWRRKKSPGSENATGRDGTRRNRSEEKNKLTFKEKREFEGLEEEIAQLENEKEEVTHSSPPVVLQMKS